MRAAAVFTTLWIACVLSASAQNPPRASRRPSADLPEINPYTSAADVAIGRAIYNGRCGHCHGLNGEGGRGAVLNAGRFRHGGSDRELFTTIRNGVPCTEMPGVNIPDMEVWRIVAYVQQLGRQGGSDPATGDPVAGAAVYASAACAQCHTIGTEGGLLGPDLTDIGSRRSVRYIRQSIVDPSADIALDYRAVSVTDAKGTVVTGIHLNEDEYSVHLRDAAGNLRSFMKSELKGMTLPRQSLMPAYTTLSAGDLENLVAYLASLRPQIVWTFDRLENIGGHKTTVLGAPTIIDSPVGKAIQFDGIDDALFIDDHPLAGAAAFTWEAIFRPDGGAAQQRWFHLSEQGPGGVDTENRLLFEIRVVGNEWYLDSYGQSGLVGKALMNREARHPLAAWYHVAAVYDGREFRNYVDGVREGAAEIRLAPHGAGHTSVGTRITREFYFKGAVRLARFTRRALAPAEFLSLRTPSA